MKSPRVCVFFQGLIEMEEITIVAFWTLVILGIFFLFNKDFRMICFESYAFLTDPEARQLYKPGMSVREARKKGFL